jgi:MioC protein
VKFELVVGSVLGASEYVAEALKEQLETSNHQAIIHFEPKVSDINFTNTIVIVTSTHGAGDLPDNIQAFAQELEQQHLPATNFLIIGLGDSSYDTFCQGAITMEETLTGVGARLLHPPIHIDVLHHPVPEDEAIRYMEEVLTSL